MLLLVVMVVTAIKSEVVPTLLMLLLVLVLVLHQMLLLGACGRACSIHHQLVISGQLLELSLAGTTGGRRVQHISIQGCKSG
jgi:hypothetical protein